MEYGRYRRRKVAARMDYLYTLYDALVSISVPTDKARAVVEAMERDMGTTLATKNDLLLLDQKLLRIEQRLDSRCEAIEQRLEAVKHSLEKDMEVLKSSMIVRLGSLQVVTLGLLFAALKLT